jgi:transmembrane sensor
MSESRAIDAADREAAAWTLRLEAGLTPSQKAELSAWLAADSRHSALLAEHRRAWARFAPLAVDAQCASGPAPARGVVPRRVHRWARPALAAAAVVALAFFLRTRERPPASPTATVAAAVVLPAPCEVRVLPDGSMVSLNRGARLSVDFSAGERRVRLVSGEANFEVAKDAARPFIVAAGGVEVRAVGTVFNVRLGAGSADVLVTEGAVDVRNAAQVAPGTLVRAGEHAALRAAGAPAVAALSPLEMERALAWQPRLLEFDDAALAEIVAAFNRRNAVQLVVADPALGAVRMTTSFRSDNVAGFVRLIEAGYGIVAESRGEGVVALRRR